MAFLGMGLGKDNSPHRLRALQVKDKLPQLAVSGVAPATTTAPLVSMSARGAASSPRASELWDAFGEDATQPPPDTARSAPSGGEKSRWLDHAGEVRPRRRGRARVARVARARGVVGLLARARSPSRPEGVGRRGSNSRENGA